MNKRVNKFLPNKNKTELTFKNTELSSHFSVKTKIDFEHNHDNLSYELSTNNFH